MGRYPAEPLESKLAWMRAKQDRKRAEAPAAVPAPPRESTPPQFFRAHQVARMLNVSVKTVQRWFRRHAVIVRGGRKTTMLISQRALDDWIREHGPSSR